MRSEAVSIAQDTRDRVIAVETTMKAILEELREAKQGRARLYDKVDNLEDKIDATETAAKDTVKRLEAIEPTVADINRWRERGIGAWLLVIGLSAVLGGAVSKVLTKLWALVTG